PHPRHSRLLALYRRALSRKVCTATPRTAVLRPQLASPTTFTHLFLSLGPSNSQKNPPCHLPSANFPSSTKIIALVPVIAVFACESEFPSLCLYGPDRGTNRANTPSRSVATSGSKCSLIITPAVVCGTYT